MGLLRAVRRTPVIEHMPVQSLNKISSIEIYQRGAIPELREMVGLLQSGDELSDSLLPLTKLG